jgi:hypothetical protein
MGRSGLRMGTIGGVIGAAAMLALASCGSNDGYGRQPVMEGDGGTQAQMAELRRRRAPRPSQPPPATDTGGTSTSTSGGTSTDQIIKAAQTADGQAIPQPAGPGGVCPAVVQALGFWSCPTIGEACSFSSGGATRQCTCSRTDGEGQFPSWICS